LHGNYFYLFCFPGVQIAVSIANESLVFGGIIISMDIAGNVIGFQPIYLHHFCIPV